MPVPQFLSLNSASGFTATNAELFLNANTDYTLFSTLPTAGTATEDIGQTLEYVGGSYQIVRFLDRKSVV